MRCTLSLILFSFSVTLSVAEQNEPNIKEIGKLLDTITKNECFLLVTLGTVVNEIRKTVNEEVYEVEKISEAAGKCAANYGDQAVRMTETVLGNYVQTMLEKIKRTKNTLLDHKASVEALESARKSVQAERGEIVISLAVLRDEVLLPEANRLSKKMDNCKEQE